jgi:UDP-glucose 4-epimerase
MNPDDILLIGGNGFIGSALAARLLAEGRRLHVVSPNLPPPDAAPGAVYHQACMSDPSLLAEILPRCRTIVHAASATTPGSSARRPSLEGALNIEPSLALIEALDALERFHFIFISSGGTVYGDPDTLPAAESHPLRPKSYYAAGKIALETFFRLASRPPGRTVSIVRPANVYGPGQAFRLGFGVIRTMLEHLANETSMEIWGSGEAVRDYLYIDDMVDALVRLIRLPEDDSTYNIGSGIGLSLNRLVRIVEDVCGRRLETRHRQRRCSDVSGIVLDSSLFCSRTQWQPKVSIEEGILATWQWLSTRQTVR